MASKVPPTTVAILGSSISLPQNINSREKLFEVVRDKKQVSSDHVESGRYQASDIDCGRDHPWKLKNRWSNSFRSEEREEYDAAFFHISGKVVRNIQVEQLCVLQSAYEAIEDAGITLSELHNTTTGIFVAGYTTFLACPNAPDETNLRGSIMSTLADQVAYFLGTHGPTVTLETACSSSLVAMALAVASLQKGDCDMAIVVGNNSLTHKDFHLSLQACGVLVEGPASFPFDEDAPKGFLRCEGTGAMVLKRTAEAVQNGDRILCEIVAAIAGSAGAAEGCTEGAGRVYEQPCAKGMREMFKRATTLNGISTADIDYMECHATGTAVGDVIELDAVAEVYGEAHTQHNPLRVASIKSNIGHAEIAAGIFSLTKAVEMLRKRVFLPTAGVTKPRTDFDWAGHNMRVQQTVEPFPEDKKVVVAVSSFGIGGSYGHVLVREWRPDEDETASLKAVPVPSSPRKPLIKAKSLLGSKKSLTPERPRAPPTAEVGYQIMPLSGFSLNHLKLYAGNVAAYLRERPNTRLADVCGTMALRRSRFPFRKAFVASSTEDLAAQLETFAKSGTADAIGEARSLRTAFILTGQGSQWAKNGVELMDTFPIYRQCAEAVDKQFTALAGWSLLEKINTLSTDDMRETKFAQPITFLVQVALLETLKHFHVYPDVVVGHSAGEVTAAYAAGLLTLEEAVQVVYHRSSEQQKLAGTGRMLAIGLGSEEVLELIKGKPALELACMNSPQSSVVAGPEDQLTALKESLPQGTSSTFIPGNIAFHSSRCAPILESMKKRLAFLELHSNAAWSVPLVSTVTGKVVTATPPQYWADNVRQPVLFQKAIETAFNMDPAPELALEIGPHRTLVGPTQQTLQGMEGKSAKVVSVLNRKESNTLTLLQTLGTLFEAGYSVDFGLHFRDDVHYKFEEDLPKHPFIKKNIRGGSLPVIFSESNVSDFNAGPAAGSHRVFSETFALELCDRTAKAMCNHKMGGEAVVAGGFYSEMALEAHNHLPVTLVNVEYKAKLAIPKASAGDSAVFVVLNLKDEQDGMRSFTIQSCPSRDKYRERPVMVEHCSGKIVKNDCLTPEDEIKAGPVPEAHGIMGHLELKDLGKDGLAALRAAHVEQEHDNKESFYETYACEGRNEYIDNYKLTTGLWVDPVGATVLSRVEHDNTEWVKEGGKYAVELLDNMTHQSLYSSMTNVIYYAGGYEAAHFLRQPSTTTLWALWRPDHYMTQVGRKKMSGDFLLYDDNGKLLVHIHKYFCMFIIQGDNYKLCTLDWQPAALVTPQAVLAKALQSSLVKGLEAWGPNSNRVMTAWVAKQLSKRGIVSVGSGDSPLTLADLAAGASDGAITLPAAAKLQERIEAVLDALAKKLQAASSDKKEDKKAVQDDDDTPLSPSQKELELTEDEITDLRQVAYLQRAEADALAEALLKLAAEEQKVHTAEEVQAVGIGLAPFTLRVIEIAEDVHVTGAERLSNLELPQHLHVEYFVASHNQKVLKQLGRNFNRRCKQVVLRRLLLPNGRSPAATLKDMTFHAVVFDDWAKTGSAAWVPEEEEAEEGAEEVKSVGSVISPALNALTQLKPFLSPAAQVVVRGLAFEPVWLDILSLISVKPLPLPENGAKAESEEAQKEVAAMAAKEWTAALETFGAQPVEKADGLLLSGALPAALEVPAGRFVIVASSDEQVAAVRAATRRAVDLDVVLVTEESTVDTIKADLAKIMAADEAAAPKVEELDDGEDSGVEETKSSDSNPRKAGDRSRISGFLFVAGLNDESKIGQDGFSRLLRVSQALMQSEEGLSKHLSASGEGPALWVVTQGVYGGEVRPNQGTLQGLTTVLYSELRMVGTKHLDLDTMADLPAAIEVALSSAREQSYRVVKGQAKVARFVSLIRDELKSKEIRPTSKQNFFVDTSAGELILKRAIPHPLGVMTAFYRLRELPPPGDNEVQIDIHAAALNFRDVMVALNMLAEKSYEASYYGKNLGLEAAGIITAVGKNVKDLKVGQPVMCGEPRCFTNRLNAPADRVVPLSSGDSEKDAKMTVEEREASLVKAAATQSVYNTCHHALINLARIRKGERVLIHSAAGGVGHAAISICKYKGAIIYATAGSPEKRQLVKDMGVDFVYDSRSTSWFADLMRDTDQQGVDVVLNSLAGMHQRLGVQALRSSGRFLEIGKMDIFDNSSLGLIAFRKNISFFAIDMDRLALDDPELSAEVAREVGKHMQAGDYHALPTTLFPMGKLREALEFMKTGKHIGKVVLTNYDDHGKEIPTTVGLDAHIFRPDITYLITGAAGGFGAKLIRYAFIQGARHFIITTRNPRVEEVMSKFAYIGKDAGVAIKVVVADTSDPADIKKMLDVARAAQPPCKAIYHLAGISGDVKVGDMKDRVDFEKVALCKAYGAWELHEQSKDMELEQFVTVSSIAALIGGMGNAAYSAANAYLDALVRYRRSLGLPATTFNMSSLSDAGILVKNLQARRFQMKMGVEYMTAQKAMEELELGMQANLSPVVTMFFKEQTRHMFPSQSAWSHLLDEPITLGVSGGKTGPMSVKEIAAFLADEIKSITQASEVLITSSLVSLGLDSFGFVELGGRIQKQFNIDINSVKLTPEQSLLEVAQLIYKLQKRSEGAAGGADGANGGEEEAEAEALASSAAMSVIMKSRFDAAKEARPTSKILKKSVSARLLSHPSTVLLPNKTPTAYVLFGATGLMGSHMLRYLIKGGAKKVYCVVRAATHDAAYNRIVKCMEGMRIWKPEFADAIVALPGDLLSDDFGLSADTYEELVNEVAHIVHAAGSRAWGMDQAGIECNSKGVMNCVGLARKNGAAVHYVSSSWLDIYDAAINEADKVELNELPYMGIKRKGEEILRFAAKNCDVRCYSYRVPLLSVNSRGGFFGDFILFTSIQGMYNTGVGPVNKGMFPIQTTDSAAKFVVKTMRGVPADTKSKALTYTSLPYAELLPWNELVDIADQIRPGALKRGTTNEDYLKAMEEVIPKVLLDGAGAANFASALERASANLMEHSKPKSIGQAMSIAVAKRKEKALASVYFKEYLRRKPEVITEGALVKMWQQGLARKKKEAEEAEAARLQAEQEGTANTQQVVLKAH